MEESIQYTKEDQAEILRIAKVVNATHEDMESIYALYRKYIIPNAPMYVINCNCGTSISSYYQKLIDWYASNSYRF